MEDGELNSLIEGLSQQGSGSGQLLLTQQNHYVVSNTFISTDTPFPTPTPSPSPSIILRSPAPSPGQSRSPARPNTPQPSLAQFSSIAPNSNQLVQLFQNQSNSLVSRAQIIQTSAVQSAALKGKQPQQILPKPLPIGASSAKQTVTRINQPISQQAAPLLINQPQQNQTLLLNQMLTSSAPMLVQPGGGVHLMLRPPTPTMQNGPGPNQGKVLLGSPSPQQAPTVLIQQNRQQVVRIMTAHGPMQLQQIQTPSGPQLLAIPANQSLSFPPNSVLVQGGAGPIHLQQATQPSIQLQQMQPQQPQQQQHHPPQQQLHTVKPKKSCAGGGGKRPKPIKSRSDSSTSPTSSREDLSPSHASPKVSARLESLMTSPMSSPPMVSLPSPTQKNVTSSLRQIRPTAFSRKQSVEQMVLKDMKGDAGEMSKQGLIPPPPVIDNLTATINSVAENFKSPSPDEPMGDVLSGTQNLNLNKRPNLTIFQKKRPEEKPHVYPTIQIAETDSSDDNRRANTSISKKTAAKKKGKKDESKVDLWDLMKSAGIGDEEFEEAVPNELPTDSLEISADSDLLAQLQNSQQLPGNLRLAVGEDGRHILIDGNNIIIPEVQSTPQVSHSNHILSSNESGPMLTPQALATAQNQLTQLLQNHGTITQSDQQMLTQIFTVNPSQGVESVGNRNVIVSQTSTSQSTNTEDVVENETMVIPEPAPVPTNAPKVETVTEYVSAPPPGLPPLGPDSLVITNNNGVPTLVASPALVTYLQKHQGIIQFQHDPVTKTLQPSLIIPHPQVQQTTQVHQTIPQQVQQSSGVERVENKSPRLAAPAPNKTIHIVDTEAGQNLSNAVRNANAVSAAQLDSMARMIKNNPNLLQVARDTNSLITYKETCSSLTQAEIADIDRKIQNNKNVLDQCFHMEMGKEGGSVTGKENIGLTLQQLQNLDMNLLKGSPEPSSTITPNSDFQNKFIESIGMANNVQTVVYPAPTATGMKTTVVNQPVQAAPTVAAPKRSRKKKADKTEVQTTPPQQQLQQPPKRVINQSTTQLPPPGNLTFNIKQLTAEQNERLNIALAQRGVTANRVALCEMTELEKQIIEEEIKKVTGGTLGNTTVKFFPPPSMSDESNRVQTQQVSSIRYFTEDEVDDNVSSAMVLNNPNLNQLLDAGPVGSQLVSLGNPIHSGNQVVTLGSPPPGSVLLGSNGQVVAYVQQAPGRGVPTLQLSASKQQMLKSVQMQIQAIMSKPVRTASDSATYERLLNEQQKILQSGKLIGATPHPSQPIQIVSQGQVFQTSYVQTKTTTSTSTGVSCGTSTSDMPLLAASSPNSGKSVLAKNTHTQLPMIDNDHPTQYTPLYINPNSANKHVTKCEKGTSPIQIQMGTQTIQAVEFGRGGKMSTGTNTSPNTGKPQAVVAPAVHMQHSEPQLTHSNIWTKQPRPPPTPVITISKTALIEKQMLTDQTGASRPDVDTPFLSTSDAVKRLVRYHVMEEKGLSVQDLQAADDMFETTAHHLLDKFHAMKNKYKYLLLMESMRETSTAERIMVDRNFIIEERIELEDLREQEKRAEDLFVNPPSPIPPQLQNVSAAAPASSPKTEASLSEANVMELNDSMSESDSLSSFRMDCDDAGLSTPQPDSANITAQVQSAIDSILNLRQSDDQDDKRKRKRLRHGAGGSGGDGSRKRERRRGDAHVHEGEDGDPVLDEAIRSILSS